jgi:hypothetical protein
LKKKIHANELKKKQFAIFQSMVVVTTVQGKKKESNNQSIQTQVSRIDIAYEVEITIYEEHVL